ncbi:MAG: ATP-binding cassette domain-containing protein [archaeon]
MATKKSEAIEVKGLTKRFSTVTALDDISFSVKQGERFAFLGPNGAGKTTTIKILTTLLHANEGMVKVNGHDPQKHMDLVRKSFGIVFQDPSLDDELSAYENMEFHAVCYGVPRKEQGDRIRQLLTFVDLWDRRMHRVKTFSGGMKRRLEIARGLIHHPRILFLDEPTLGLDPQTRINIWEHIHRLSKDKDMTVFFTTHYMEEAEKVADRVAIIDHGRIISMGTVKEIMKRTGTKSLENAFLKLTGKSMREQTANPEEQLRMHRKVWRH